MPRSTRKKCTSFLAVRWFPAVFLSGGWATHVSAWRSLTNRTANMDVLISMENLPPYLIGLVAVADTVKPDSQSAVVAMHAIGSRVVMITGYNQRAANAIAEEVGIDEVHAGVLPEGKVEQFHVALVRIFCVRDEDAYDIVLGRAASDPDLPASYRVHATGIGDPVVGYRWYRYGRIGSPGELGNRTLVSDGDDSCAC